MNIPHDGLTYLDGPLMNMIQTSYLKITNLNRSGFYNGRRLDQLDYAFSNKILDYLKRQKSTLVGQLDQQKEHFNEIKESQLANILSGLQNATLITTIDQQISKNKFELRLRNAKISALRSSLNADDNSFGDKGLSLEKLFEQDLWRNVYSQDLVPYLFKQLVITSKSGTIANPDKEFIVRNFAVNSDNALEAQKGDILTISASGRWSPTCAIERSWNPNDPYLEDIMSANTGPEGFNILYSTDHEKLISSSMAVSNTTYADIGESNRSCTGGNASAGISFFGTGGSVSRTRESCSFSTYGTRRDATSSESQSSLNASRSSASFANGVRRPDTPFPDMPAGALLLVAVPRTTASIHNITEVHVIQESTTIISPQNSLYYLVVNDCLGDRTDLGHISLTISQKRPIEFISLKLQKAMTDSIE
jgi:hypothetical protein